MKFLETLLLLGILGSLLTLGDLILRPHQREKFQELFETFTLWLADIKSINWFDTLVRSERLQYALTLASVYAISIAILYIEIEATGASWKRILLVVVALICVPPLLAHYVRHPVPIAINHKDRVLSWQFRSITMLSQWLYRPEVLRVFAFKQIVFITGVAIGFSSLICLFVYVLAPLLAWSFSYIQFELGKHPWYFSVPYFIGFFIVLAIFSLLRRTFFSEHGQFIVLIVLLAFSVIALFASIFVVFLDICLMISKGIAWRIAEYGKGAFAAIVLIATAVLGILKLIEN